MSDGSVAYCRIVIETADAGDDPEEAVRWLSEWAAQAGEAAPFAVEHIHVEAVAHGETLDV